MNKICTSIEQSKHLIKLGIDTSTADMDIGNYVGESGKVDGTNVHYYLKGEEFGAPEIIPCWSLSALMHLMPTHYVVEKCLDSYWCYIFSVKEFFANTAVDAAFEMVCWLLENKKL